MRALHRVSYQLLVEVALAQVSRVGGTWHNEIVRKPFGMFGFLRKVEVLVHLFAEFGLAGTSAAFQLKQFAASYVLNFDMLGGNFGRDRRLRK